MRLQSELLLSKEGSGRLSAKTAEWKNDTADPEFSCIAGKALVVAAGPDADEDSISGMVLFNVCWNIDLYGLIWGPKVAVRNHT